MKKEYKKIKYEFNNVKGEVIIEKSITDENEMKKICIEDYLQNNIKIINEGEM